MLVEGITDELALRLAAGRLGVDLSAAGVSIVPTNGAHAWSGFLMRLVAAEPQARFAGLYDAGEEAVISAALRRAGLDRAGFFACHADLEDELIRSAGESTLSRLIEREGDAQPWHTFRKQQAWHGRPMDRQFRRFIRSVSERNSRYIRAIVETIDPSSLPEPIRRLLGYVSG